MTQTQHYDITIIGAGMVGLLLACTLAKSSLRIAIIDYHQPPEIIPDTTDIRLSAITITSQHLLKQLGAWSFIPSNKISPFRNMHIWNAQRGGSINFNSSDIHEQALGYIIENRVMQAALFQQLKRHSNIDFICPVELKNLEINEDYVVLALETSLSKINSTNKGFPIAFPQQFKTTLLIGADGHQSRVRQLAGIEITSWDYKQSALVCNVRTRLPHQETAWQQFLPTGPLAFLPLSDPYSCSIVWSTTPSEAEYLLKLSDEDFKNKLMNSFESRLGAIEEISRRAIFPLQMQHVRNYVKPHLALVGDAAHTIHPLAGQGVNLGFQDAMVLAEIILSAHEKKQELGSLHTLRRYERSRKSENTVMIAFIEMIKKIFSCEASSLRTIANVGLDLTNKITPLKRFFMRRATGLSL